MLESLWRALRQRACGYRIGGTMLWPLAPLNHSRSRLHTQGFGRSRTGHKLAHKRSVLKVGYRRAVLEPGRRRNVPEPEYQWAVHRSGYRSYVLEPEDKGAVQKLGHRRVP